MIGWHQRTGGGDLSEGDDNAAADGSEGNDGAQGAGNGSGGSAGGTSGGNTGGTSGTGGNNEPVIDHENGTVHDGTVEF